MIKRSTLFMLVIFIITFAVYLLLRSRISTTSIVATPTPTINELLITPADGKLETLRIVDNDHHETQIQRGITGLWEISLPRLGTVDQSLAAAAETQVGALKVVSRLNTSPELKDIGLDLASYTLTLIFTGGKQHILEIGASTPTRSGYYVRVDGGSIFIISQDGINALVNLITSPPYAPTETLVPSPSFTYTDTPAFTITLTSTPTP
jgi:hypothetical protein